MLTPATVFKLVNEFIVLLLGSLLIVLAISGRVGPSGRPAVLILLGVLLLYWGLRAWFRPGPAADRLQPRIRAGSLLLIGLLVLGIRFVPLRYVDLLLGLAGGVLVVRGISGGVLFARQR
jgi:hypothetical protein